MRAQREDGAAQDKTGDDDRGEIMDEPVKQIGGGIPPPFLLDEAVRLKNKIGQQMRQVDRQKVVTYREFVQNGLSPRILAQAIAERSGHERISEVFLSS